MFPLGVPKGLASPSEERSAFQPAAVAHLADLDQLRTAAGGGAAMWGTSRESRNNSGSSAFGAHGFAGGASALGGVGFGGGRSQASDKKTAIAPKSTGAVKTPTAPKSPAPPRAPSSAAPVVAPAPTVAVPPADPAPVATAPTLAPPVTAVTVAPPIFSNQTTPIPAIAGGSPITNAGPPAGVVGGGRVVSKGASLSGTPEPASLLLIVTGLAAVIGVSRRRQLQRP
ncbi:MAG TPA: PEP-CTERM sorting domain-containing protein [Vicinamibacterales bacterium]|nr:PEP-CTERM sorting domain-containing protein [Vicinamibacterales bacterium]